MVIDIGMVNCCFYRQMRRKTVIARSEATWQSPGTMFVTALQIDGWFQEIPTGLTALGMTQNSKNFVFGGSKPPPYNHILNNNCVFNFVREV